MSFGTLSFGRLMSSTSLGGGGTAPAAGVAATTFATAPTVHYHFNSQSLTVDGGGRLVSCPDRMGLAQLLAIAGVTAPKVMTDLLGRKFLRFNGSDAAAIDNALNGVANRGFGILAVIRVPHQRGTTQIVNPRFAAYTSPTVNTEANTSIGYMRGTVTSLSAQFLQAGNPATSANATDCYKVVPHSGMQVLAIASRTTANGGTRLYQNNDTCDVAQQTSTVTGYIGALIGALPGTSNSEGVNTGTGTTNVFDLYELAFWKGEIANASFGPMVAAAVTNFNIAQLDTNYLLPGTSLTDGIATVLGVSPAWSGSISTVLTEPGAELVGPNVRVLSIAASGSTLLDLTARRDAANSMYAAVKYPGGPSKNIVALEAGRNDVGLRNLTSAAFYTELIAFINTTSTGVLQRGWSIRMMGNIATANTATTSNSPPEENTLHLRIEGIRAKVFNGGAGINTTFQNDVLAGTGQAFEGLVTVVPLHLITVGGDTKFLTTADAQDTASGYYDSDQTHLTSAGHGLMGTGGDTTTYGYRLI